MRAPALACACIGWLACTREPSYRCDGDAQCVEGSRRGTCESTMWCSFDDPACGSGRRYGTWSGDGLADRCVPDDAAETSASSGASTLTSVTPIETSSGSDTTSTGASSSSTDATTGTGDESTGGPLPDGLVLWYRFDEASFDGLVIDATGKHGGTCEGVACPMATTGVHGGAAAFDGVDDVLQIADDPELHLEAGWTLATWARIPDAAAFRCIIAKPLAMDTNADSFELAREDSGLAFAAVADTPTTGIFASAAWPVAGATWVHVASTWDGAALTLYVAGAAAAVTDTPSSTAFTELDVFVGASLDEGVFTNFLAGDLDDLQIYARPLAAAEIAALATAQ
ncbi:MAG: LamG domain-containing protein [Deltaproteobacteria bacterium]|nr:LamG domain-containing protein [Deltaproteobacteria bacterium]